MRKRFSIPLLSFSCLAFALLSTGCATELVSLVETSGVHWGHDIFHSAAGITFTLSAIGLIKVVRG